MQLKLGLLVALSIGLSLAMSSMALANERPTTVSEVVVKAQRYCEDLTSQHILYQKAEYLASQLDILCRMQSPTAQALQSLAPVCKDYLESSKTIRVALNDFDKIDSIWTEIQSSYIDRIQNCAGDEACRADVVNVRNAVREAWYVTLFVPCRK